MLNLNFLINLFSHNKVYVYYTHKPNVFVKPYIEIDNSEFDVVKIFPLENSIGLKIQIFNVGTFNSSIFFDKFDNIDFYKEIVCYFYKTDINFKIMFYGFDDNSIKLLEENGLVAKRLENCVSIDFEKIFSNNYFIKEIDPIILFNLISEREIIKNQIDRINHINHSKRMIYEETDFETILKSESFIDCAYHENIKEFSPFKEKLIIKKDIEKIFNNNDNLDEKLIHYNSKLNELNLLISQIKHSIIFYRQKINLEINNDTFNYIFYYEN